jgi:hypothetical protein
MTKHHVFYFALRKENFFKIMNESIPKYDFKKAVSMYQNLDSAISESRLLSREEKCNYVVCEIMYDLDKLLELYVDKRLIPPTWWLVLNRIVSSNSVDSDDLMLFEKFYSTASFDFNKISITKGEIQGALSVDKNEITKIYPE